MTTDLVVLVPGFLGFESFGPLSYFGTRLSIADELARALDVRVEVATTVPAGTLALRQSLLLDQLCRWDEEEPPLRIHLLGHSTGGVDAELLTRARPLVGAAWSPAAAIVRAKLRTVITCASPMAGTWLAASDVGEFVGALGGGGILASLHRPGADEAAWLALSAMLSAATNPSVVALLIALFSDPRRALPFLSSVVKHHELIAELHPAAMPELYAGVGGRALNVYRRSIVTVAPPPPPGARSTLYAALDHALRRATPPADAALASRVRRLERAADAAITSAWTPQFDAASNDGVVNSALQWLGSDPILLVVADHLDVLGEAAPSAARIYGGLLENSAGYGAPEASQLRSHVVKIITSAARARQRPRAEVLKST